MHGPDLSDNELENLALIAFGQTVTFSSFPDADLFTLRIMLANQPGSQLQYLNRHNYKILFKCAFALSDGKQKWNEMH